MRMFQLRSKWSCTSCIQSNPISQSKSLDQAQRESSGSKRRTLISSTEDLRCLARVHAYDVTLSIKSSATSISNCKRRQSISNQPAIQAIRFDSIGFDVCVYLFDLGIELLDRVDLLQQLLQLARRHDRRRRLVGGLCRIEARDRRAHARARARHTRRAGAHGRDAARSSSERSASHGRRAHSYRLHGADDGRRSSSLPASPSSFVDHQSCGCYRDSINESAITRTPGRGAPGWLLEGKALNCCPA